MVDQMPWLAKCVRPMLKAAPGTIYRGADLTGIEGRVNAWQAGELWKLDMYRLEDAGLSYGSYHIMAGSILGVPLHQVTGAQRQALGKVPELFLGYQGSVGAAVTGGAAYGVKPEDMAEVVALTASPEQWAKTERLWRPNTSAGLPAHIWTGVKIIVDGWRAKNPAIVQSWWDNQDAAVEAVSSPGSIIPCGKVRYLFSKGFLWCQLPSGRPMAYPQPRVIRTKQVVLVPIDEPTPTSIYNWPVVKIGERWYLEEDRWRNVVEVWGIDGKTKQWQPYTLYGGLQVENICQGIARDVLDAGMKRIERAGYVIILHAHDEVLTECHPDFGSCKELADLLSQSDDWMAGLPLAAKGWEDQRYVK